MIIRVILCGLLISSISCIHSQINSENTIDSEPIKERKHQIGINILPLMVNLATPGELYNADSEGRTYIQYKYRVNDKWHFKGDLSLWLDYGSFTYNSGTKIIEEGGKYYKLERFRKNGVAAVRGGAERQLNKYFSIGGNLILGIDKYRYSNLQQEVAYDSTYQTYEGASDFGTERLEQQMLAFGASIDLNLNMPIGERWAMVLRYEPQYIRSLPWKNDYQSNNTFIETLGRDDLGYARNKIRHNIDLVLAFKL